MHDCARGTAVAATRTCRSPLPQLLFDLYASSGSGDFTQISLNGYRAFLADTGLQRADDVMKGHAARWDELVSDSPNHLPKAAACVARPPPS